MPRAIWSPTAPWAGSVVPMTFDVGRATDLTVAVRRVRVKKTSTSVTNASFRLHLYQTSPTVTNGDNGAWLSIMAGYLGNVDVTVDKAFSDGAGGVGSPASGVEINAQVGKGTTTIFGLLEARAAYTPGNAEVITVELELWQN
jgi:hypothetical protein